MLRRIAADLGRIEVVLDDGSHVSEYVVASFETLFPLLAPGVLYIVEDIGTSYWPELGGSRDPGSPATSMAYFKRLADGVNHLDSQGAIVPTAIDLTVRFVHFYASLVVVQKL